MLSLKILRAIATTTEMSEMSLITAIHNKNVGLVALLIERGVDNNDFVFACQEGNLEIVHLLIDVSSVNLNDGLQFACFHGQTKIVRMLLELPVERGVNPAVNNSYGLRLACVNGNIELARLFVERGGWSSYTYSSALQDACERGFTEIVRLMLRVPFRMNDNHALSNACRNGHLDIVRLLIANNKLLTYFAYPLRVAVMNEHTTIVRVLFEHVHVNANKQQKRIFDEAADECLQIACGNGLMSSVRVLLEYGVHPRAGLMRLTSRDDILTMLYAKIPWYKRVFV